MIYWRYKMDSGTKQMIENANKRENKYREMIDEKPIEQRIIELCEEYSRTPLEAFTEKNNQFYELFQSKIWLATLFKAYLRESQPIDKNKSVKMMDALTFSDQAHETYLFNTIGKKSVRIP